MLRGPRLLALAALVALGADVVRADDPRVRERAKFDDPLVPSKPKLIPPPQRSRETRIPHSSIDRNASRPRDPDAISAAEAKRARKAAKRAAEVKR